MRNLFLVLCLSIGATGCTWWPALSRREPAPTLPLFDNLGTYHHAVTTRSKNAQRYFDQGLRLVYGFNHDEAIRAFKEAARLDPNCAMAYWGIAYAYGPNYNMAREPERTRAAYEAALQAWALAARVSEPEQAYIAAITARYSLDPQADGKALDAAFANAMRAVSHRYPDDLDAATLFAESLMDLRPWDLWTLDGAPQPETLEIVETLESVLQRNPDHPGANHYYIHAVEASQHPERGVASAERLPMLMPGAGHLVHMPAHIYMRMGQYAEATEANRRAAEVDRQYIAVAKPEGIYPMMYYPHNVQFLCAAASMEGRSVDAITAARQLEAMLSPDMVRAMPMAEFAVPTTWFALARFGRWTELLGEPPPPADLQYSTGMWHYAHGLALARTGRLSEADDAAAQLAAIASAMPADRILADNIPAQTMLMLASETLAGEIAAVRKQFTSAIRHLRAAVQLQDHLPYTEPPPWYYPARQSLGAVLLSAGQPDAAERVYREDLNRNPNNGWSLLGLAQSLRAQYELEGAARINAQFAKAWARADVAPTASRF